jgi:multiple sugar transport system permease protein
MHIQERKNRVALPFIAPFLLVYGALFLYPTLQMIAMSFTDAHLVAPGGWVGFDNYFRLLGDWRFHTAVLNTAYFVLLTVIPSTLLGLLIAMMIKRLNSFWQGVVLALFFLPYILPVSTVTSIWYWLFDQRFGILQFPIEAIFGKRINVFRTVWLVLPIVSVLTVWWTTGFNILLFMAGLKNIPPELYEAATLDDATRWQQFCRITWPLIWPITALVLTLQLILQLKVFDQVYLMVAGGRVDATLVLVQYIYNLAFQRDQGGYAAAVAVALFVIVITVAVLQFQLVRARGRK